MKRYVWQLRSWLTRYGLKLILLALLLSLIVFIYLNIDSAYSIVKRQNFSPEVNAAIITAFITSFTFCGTILLTAYFNYKLQRANIRDRIYERRQDLYNTVYSHLDNIGYLLYAYEQKSDLKTINQIYEEWKSLISLHSKNRFTYSAKVNNKLFDIILFLSHGILKSKVNNEWAFRNISEKEAIKVFGEERVDHKITQVSEYMQRYRILVWSIGKLIRMEMKVKAVENDFKLLR